VTRDDELLRSMLFEFERDESGVLNFRKFLSMSQEEITRNHHVLLLADAGFVTQISESGYRLTNSGHDYLEAIRSETIWNRTVEGAAQVGGMTLGMMKDLALAYLKQEASEKLGVTF
jgi:RIO-like serine/threonine protein kinase